MIMLTSRPWGRVLPLAGIAVLGLTGLMVVGVAGCGRSKADAKLPPAQGEGAPPLPVLPAIGEKGESTSVSPTDGRTTGTTVPRAESQIGPNAGGVLGKIYVKEGDKVRRGMVLFRQLSRDAELRLDQAKAAVASARVNLKAIEIEHARTKALFEQKAVNQMDWDQIQARVEGARAGVNQAQVAESIAAKMLADCTVRSPIDGVVAAKLKNEGEMATMMPPTVVLVVQDQSVLELRFRLPEGSLAGVKAGQIVQANFEAVGMKRPAKVTRIQPSVDPRTRTVEVVAEIPNPDGTLKSGLLAEVNLAADPTVAGAVAVAPVGPAAIVKPAAAARAKKRPVKSP